MRKLIESIDQHKYHRVLGIDPSTRKIAMCVVEGGEPIAQIAIDISNGDSFERVYHARKYFPSVLDVYKPDFVCIEQTIFVQNPDTSRKLAYIVGVVCAETKIRQVGIEDVAPATWKAYMGVKPLTAAWKKRITESLGPTEGRKEIARLKKSQLQDILKERYPKFSWDDNDLADACGIALYSYSKHGRAILSPAEEVWGP